MSWKEIHAWLEVADRQLSPWEIDMIRQMSRAYVDEYYQAKDKMRPQPFSDVEMTEEKRAIVTDKFKAWKASIKKQ